MGGGHGILFTERSVVTIADDAANGGEGDTRAFT